MNVNRVINVRDGDTITALQEFLSAWWKTYQFDAMLAPVELSNRSGVELQVITDSQGLMDINPFAPVMNRNAAISAAQMIQEFSKAKLAILLRPCEIRTFVELQKIGRIPTDLSHVVLLGVDCPGILPPGEFSQQVEIHGLDLVSRFALHDATKGHLQPEHIRTACQICDWSCPRGADVTIGVIGIASENFVLIIARDEITDAELLLGTVANKLATEYQVSHRETVIGALADLRGKQRIQLLENFQDNCSFNELGCILALFAGCTMCAECLEACPIYDSEKGHPQDTLSLIEELVFTSRWLASCTGCGMCEQNCSQHIPLTLLVSSLSHRICHELHYTPGDPAQQIPWLVKS
jgi:formate dehydrogenase subunit beta